MFCAMLSPSVCTFILQIIMIPIYILIIFCTTFKHPISRHWSTIYPFILQCIILILIYILIGIYTTFELPILRHWPTIYVFIATCIFFVSEIYRKWISVRSAIIILSALAFIYLEIISNVLIYQTWTVDNWRATMPDSLQYIQQNIIVKGLEAWEFPNDDKATTVLIFMGNGGHMSHYYPYIEFLHQKMNCNVVIFAYSGYSESSGIPGYRELKDDAANMLHYVNERYHGRVVLLGVSLGGAVAIHAGVAPKDHIDLIITVNTFTNISAMGEIFYDRYIGTDSVIRYGIFTIIEWLQGPWDNYWTVLDVDPKIPMMFIRGDLDPLVPPYHSAELAERRRIVAPNNTVLKTIYHATHIPSGPELYSVLEKCIYF